MTQADTAYAEVRDLLLSGAYAPGERLGEVALAARLGISRTPVREALRRLEADGLVDGSWRGVAVPDLAAAEVAHAYELRATLESAAAEAAARKVGAGYVAPVELARLRELAAAAARHTAAGELTAAIDRNRDFHRAIAELAGNPLALAVLDRLWDRLTVSARASIGPDRRRRDVSDEHDELIAAIGHGDADGARAVAHAHVLATLASLPGLAPS